MDALEKYQTEFGQPKENWTLEQWRKVATELAEIVDAHPMEKRSGNARGRPSSRGSPMSAAQNYAALAFWVEQRIQHVHADGKKITIKEAVRQEILAAIKRRNDSGKSTREGHVDRLLDTAYTEVRKILAVQKADKK